MRLFFRLFVSFALSATCICTVKVAAVALMMRNRVQRDPLCEECGYNLRGLTSLVCPECGTPFEAYPRHQSQIAWARRRQIGWIKGYLLTVVQVLFSPQIFAREVYLGLDRSASDGVLFQRVTLCLASLFSGICLAICAADVTGHFSRRLFLLVAGLLICLNWIYFLVAATSVSVICLSSRDGSVLPQMRSMLRYACAPLALTPLAIVPALIEITVGLGNQGKAAALLIVFWMIVMLFLWWVMVFRIARRVNGGSWRIVCEAGVLVSCIWFAVALLFYSIAAGAIRLFEMAVFS